MAASPYELGSNLYSNIGFMGMDEFRRNLEVFLGRAAGEDFAGALHAAGEVFRSAIQAATPTGSDVYSYMVNGKRRLVRHKSPGQAKAHVIIYERKIRGDLASYSQGYMNLQTFKNEMLRAELAPPPGLLIGYEKKHAYYMYFYEYGAVHAQKELVNISYVTKKGKVRFRKKNVYVGHTIQRPRPFFRATFDGAVMNAFSAARDYMASRVGG